MQWRDAGYDSSRKASKRRKPARKPSAAEREAAYAERVAAERAAWAAMDSAREAAREAAVAAEARAHKEREERRHRALAARSPEACAARAAKDLARAASVRAEVEAKERQAMIWAAARRSCVCRPGFKCGRCVEADLEALISEREVEAGDPDTASLRERAQLIRKSGRDPGEESDEPPAGSRSPGRSPFAAERVDTWFRPSGDPWNKSGGGWRRRPHRTSE